MGILMIALSREIEKKFETTFKNKPLLVRSPGRINLIGEHTDYNEGFVLPAAIDKGIISAISYNYSDSCRLISYDLNEEYSFKVDDLSKSEKAWANYIIGVVAQFVKKGLEIKGFDAVFGGNVPIGAGLSSSAALECAFAYAFNTMFKHGVEKIELVKMAQRAEHEYAGVQCGIMDQFASIFGKNDHAIQLDCKTLKYKYLHLDLSNYRVVLCDTQMKHSLASSEYNNRNRECKIGVALLKKHYPAINSLRDANIKQIEDLQDRFDLNVYKRCKYVIEENNRVIEAGKKVKEGDIESFGELMYSSHSGLSKDYEVSCKELDFLVEKARLSNYVIGARMMGGGFGGCTINIVKEDKVDKFIDSMKRAYKDELKLDLKTYVVKAANGTSRI
jgi:galactokinase